MTVRYAITLIGALSVAGVHFWVGRELARWAPASAGRVIGMLGIILLPVLLGTAVVILINLPVRPASVAAIVAEATFWLFAAIGALLPRRHSRSGGERLRLRWADAAVTLLAVLTVRVMARGIPFVP
jgi:hypothetical protein